MFQITNNTTAEVQLVASLDGIDLTAWSSEELAQYPTLDILKADKKAAIEERFDQAVQAGFTPASGPLAGHLLQTRDLTDRTNWIESRGAYSAEVSAGNGAVMAAEFRDAANVSVVCSYADGLSTLLAMAAWSNALMKNSWSLKDQVNAAADQAALDAIDIETGWTA